MAGKVVVETYGFNMLAQELTNVGSRGADITPYGPNLLALMELIELEQFDSRGARGPHGPWPSNTRDWTFYKVSHKPPMSPELMRATDAMFQALTDTNAEGAVRDVSHDHVGFGANLKQFAIWQGGHNDGKGKRLPIDFNEADLNEISEGILGYIVGAMGARPSFVFDRNGRKRAPKGGSGKYKGGQFMPRDIP